MNMLKANGGFTLVELIVVIAILGILAGVTIPTYSGYIEKAQGVEEQLEDHKESVDNLAESIWAEADLGEWNADGDDDADANGGAGEGA